MMCSSVIAILEKGEEMTTAKRGEVCDLHFSRYKRMLILAVGLCSSRLFIEVWDGPTRRLRAPYS